MYNIEDLQCVIYEIFLFLHKLITEIENMRHRIIENHQEMFNYNEHEVSKRWTFEEGVSVLFSNNFQNIKIGITFFFQYIVMVLFLFWFFNKLCIHLLLYQFHF